MSRQASPDKVRTDELEQYEPLEHQGIALQYLTAAGLSFSKAFQGHLLFLHHLILD